MCQNSPLSRKFEKLFTEKGGKFEFSAQGEELAPFVGNVTKVKIPSEVKPSLVPCLQVPTTNSVIPSNSFNQGTNRFIDQFDGIFQTYHLIWKNSHQGKLHIFLN